MRDRASRRQDTRTQRRRSRLRSRCLRRSPESGSAAHVTRRKPGLEPPVRRVQERDQQPVELGYLMTQSEHAVVEQSLWVASVRRGDRLVDGVATVRAWHEARVEHFPGTSGTTCPSRKSPNTAMVRWPGPVLL